MCVYLYEQGKVSPVLTAAFNWIFVIFFWGKTKNWLRNSSIYIDINVFKCVQY